MKHLTHNKFILPVIALIILFSASCIQSDARQISVTILADQESTTITIPQGSSVREALDQVELFPGTLDQVKPPLFTILNEDTNITLSRVREEFIIDTAILPFSRQTIRSESMAEGETLLLQPGENGLEEITIRVLSEDGIETSRTITSRVTVTPPQTEIMMIGVEPSYMPVPLEGIVAYIETGNAWILKNSSHEKIPLVLSGDLDNRIFELSSDGEWLLFSRANLDSEGNDINSLWIVSTKDSEQDPIDLKINNVIHFASWSPEINMGYYRIAYSTVEPRNSAPGWQANNDLRILSISPDGRLLQTEIVLEENPGGQYGWWGTFFSWSPDASAFSFTRADAVGIIDPENPSYETLLETVPFEVRDDYVWTPEAEWGPESEILYIHVHNEDILTASEQDPGTFSLLALDINVQTGQILLENVGVFAFPSINTGAMNSTENWIVLLMPVDPAQLMNTHYYLTCLDADGSNYRILFPPEGEFGLDPYPPVQSPYDQTVLFSHQQDLWLLDPSENSAIQLTGSGQVSGFDWK